jgi:single-strand DNA-binding protein
MSIMASVNKVTLIGNCGRDPELRHSANGAAVCNLSIATTRSWKNKTSGEREEETEWHRVVFYDRLAEIVGEYVKKGRSLYVEGRLKTRKWTDKDGVEKYTTEIVANEMTLLGGRDGQEQQQEPAAPKQTHGEMKAARRPPPPKASHGFDGIDDQIPF